MIRMKRGGEEVEIKDFLINLYRRNGYEIVTEEKPKAEPEKAEPKKSAPRKRTVRK